MGIFLLYFFPIIMSKHMVFYFFPGKRVDLAFLNSSGLTILQVFIIDFDESLIMKLIILKNLKRLISGRVLKV